MKKETQKYKNNCGAGFTLLEVLVAVAVFGVVATISVGALLSISDAQKKILSLRVTQDNIGYAIDTMGKEIRTGKIYHCVPLAGDSIDIDKPEDCIPTSGGGAAFAFTNVRGQRVVYRVANGILQKSLDGGAFTGLTSPDLVIINKLAFYVWGSASPLSGDYVQPRVMIILQGTAGTKAKTTSQVDIQTTISQRLLDS